MNVGGVEGVPTSLRIIHEEPARRINVEGPREVPRPSRNLHQNPRPESEAVHSIPRSQVSKVLSPRIDSREYACNCSREHFPELAALLHTREDISIGGIEARECLRLLQALATPLYFSHEIDAHPREESIGIHSHEDPRDLFARWRKQIIWPLHAGKRRARCNLIARVERGEGGRERVPATPLRGR